MTSSQVSDDEGFRRVHPLSPFVRGGLIAVAVLGYLVSQQVDRLTQPDAAPGGGELPFSVLVQAGAIGLTILGAIGLAFLSWWFTRYKLGEDSLEIRSGAISRQHRQVRYDRIQAVDLVRPLLARITGLSEVRVESAGGSDSHVSIAYLRHHEADAVRSQLLGLAARARELPSSEAVAGGPGRPDTWAEPGGPESVDAPTVPLLRVPAERLVGSVLLAPDALAFVLFVLGSLVLLAFGLAPAVGGFLPVVLVTGGRSLMRLTRWYDATVGRRGPTVTVQRGLTDTRSSTIPLHRVQAVEISQPFLWRARGWWQLKVNVAGAHFGSASAEAGEDVLVPVATTDEVLSVVEVVLGDPATTQELRALVEGTPEGFLGQPPSAKLLDPLAHRRIGALLGGRALFSRGGWVGRWLQVVPYGRVQSITVQQGPLERRLGLADVNFISTVGPVSPRVRHLATTDAERLGVVLARQASQARRGSGGVVGCDPAPDRVDWTR